MAASNPERLAKAIAKKRARKKSLRVQMNRRTEEAIVRAVRIAGRIAVGADLKVREKIAEFDGEFRRYRLDDLGIASAAWQRVAALSAEENDGSTGIGKRLVFAHPDLLQAIPDASMHYRGMALLSLKRVQAIAGSVVTWERSPETARVTEAKALRVCRLYNAVISSIILAGEDWTLQDGYRNIVASLGITEDGAMRNVVGQDAEAAIKQRLVAWTGSQGLIESEAHPERAWQLVGGVLMRFGSEPDIAFERDGDLAVIVEVKAGTDPAGALERLGAIKKTFDAAPVGCKKFLIAGVVTATMRERLHELHMEADFDIHALLNDDAAWRRFANEIFHHALRIAPEL